MVEIKPFKNQDYALLKSQHNASNLFVDPEFPANMKSIYHPTTPPTDNEIQWKRPKDVFPNPQFAVDGFKRNDLNQGESSDCWFIAACAAVTLNPDLMARVIPPNQSFDDKDYAGIFHFRFWLDGFWYDVVIDDQLPFNSENKLIYLHNEQEPNELWSPLLEKAYAKLCGSYEVMGGGFPNEALINMTAGVDEEFDIYIPGDKTVKPPNFKEKLKGLMQQAYTRKSMLGCGITPDPSENEAPLDNGLLQGHAYTITRIKDVTTKNGKTITLVRVRNPWGGEAEWTGDWSDNSKLWDTISDEEKTRLKYRKKHDGEFWMSFDDFYSNFHKVQICHRAPSSLEPTEEETECFKWSDIFEDDQFAWKEESFHGEWIPGQTAGGRADESNQEKYWTNPQYLFKLTSTDDVIFSFDDKEEELCTVIFTLMQKETRQRMLEGKENLPVRFDIFKVKEDPIVMKNIEQRKLKFYASQLEQVACSGGYTDDARITKRFRLPAGTYIIIPSTYDKDMAGKFLIRLFTEKPVDQAVTTELNRDKKNLTKDDVEFTEKDFNNLLDGIGKLLDEDDGPSSSKNSKKINKKDEIINKKKSDKKEEACSIQ